MPAKRPAIKARIDLEWGHIDYDHLGPTERLGEHVVPKELSVTFPGARDQPRLQMVLGMENGAATCRELHLVAKEGARGVRPGDLEAVRLNEWVEDLFAATAMRATTEETSPGVYRTAYRIPNEQAAADALRAARRRGARRKITDEALGEVAEVYKGAPRAPTRAVADHFGKSHRTASDYIAKARALGLIDTDKEI